MYLKRRTKNRFTFGVLKNRKIRACKGTLNRWGVFMRGWLPYLDLCGDGYLERTQVFYLQVVLQTLA